MGIKVGEMIPDQIIQSVESSRRTLIVLSKAYVDSMWTKLEFRAAHTQVDKQKNKNKTKTKKNKNKTQCGQNSSSERRIHRLTNKRTKQKQKQTKTKTKLNVDKTRVQSGAYTG